MIAAVYDIVCEQGATFRRTIVWKDRYGAPVNLSGFSARLHARPFVTSEDILVELNEDNGGAVVANPVDGRIELFIQPFDIEDLAAQEGVYDLELESALGEVYRLLQGRFKISPEVTR
jgi:hypothetical protein